MLQVIPEWLRLLFFPLHLQGDYSVAEIEQATGWGLIQSAGAALLVALALLGWRLRREAPVVPFGLLWAGAALLPVANVLVPTGIVMAERTLFLPSAGILLGSGGLAVSAAAWLRAPRSGALAPGAGAKQTSGTVRSVSLASIAVVVLVVAGVARSAVRHTDWRGHLHFWEGTTRDAPLSHKAHYAYGQLLYKAGEEEAGLAEYHTAIALAPAEYRLHRELGDLYRARGQCGPALYWYDQSLRIEPDQGTVILSRISCLMQMGRLEEAMREAAGAGSGAAAAPPPQ
jgi:tetratricopeptide (TPR) repeat protein